MKENPFFKPCVSHFPLYRFLYFTFSLCVLFCLCRCDSGGEDANFKGRDSVTGGETYEYQAEVTRLMDIIVNSIYHDKEIFLRELISNSLDALDKVRINKLSGIESKELPLEIRIECNEDEKTIKISDTGVGMTKQDLINYLGVVAKSGTAIYLDSMGKTENNQIGQFGVGFYSAFLVADKVYVISKHDDDDQYIWESSANSSFTIRKDIEGDSIERGTTIILHLKDDSTEFLKPTKIKEVTKKYGQLARFPIFVKEVKTVKKEAKMDLDKDEEQKDGDEGEGKTGDEELEKKTNWDIANDVEPIWMLPKGDVTEEQYIKLFRDLTGSISKPLLYFPISVEGEIEFKGILFISDTPPRDFYENFHNEKSNVKLFIRKILVSEKMSLLPRYLNFVSGVINSDEAPLNVAREQLQNTNIAKTLMEKLVARLFKSFADLSEEDRNTRKLLKEAKEINDDEEIKNLTEKLEKSPFAKFLELYGKSILVGCLEGDKNRQKIAKLLRFYTSKSRNETVSLDDYVERMDKEQNGLYYVDGDSVQTAIDSPHMQVFLKNDIEVLLVTDPVEELCIQKISSYDRKSFISVKKGSKVFDDNKHDAVRHKKLVKAFNPLLSWLKKNIKTYSDIVVSTRLVTDPCAVSTTNYGNSASTEKLLKAQTFVDKKDFEFSKFSRIFEINVNHPIIVDLLERVTRDENDELAKKVIGELESGALLASGYDLDDKTTIIHSIYDHIALKLGVADLGIQEFDVSQIPDDEVPSSEKHEESEDEETIMNESQEDSSDSQTSDDEDIIDQTEKNDEL